MFSMKSLASAVVFPNAKNIKALLHPNKRLSLFCDLSESQGQSASGKTIIISSTGGNKPIGASNAVLGLNVFCKTLESIDLSETTVAPFRTLTEVGPGLEWQLLDRRYLHLMMDFDNAAPKTTKSEKSTLLMSTTGIRRLGSTGVSVGLNCYCALGKIFDASGLETFGEAKEALPDYASVTLSPDGTMVTAVFDLRGIAVGGVAAIPRAAIAEGLFVNISIKKADEATSSKAPSHKAPFEPLAEGSNIMVRGAGSEKLELKFPLEDLGLSSTGKTVLRANSRGFQRAGNVRVNVIAFTKEVDAALETIIRNILAAKADPRAVSVKGELYPAVLEKSGMSELSDEFKEKIKSIAVTVLGSLQKGKRARSEDEDE